MKKILYVEDDSINALVIVRLLRNDFEMIHVSDGESCFAKVQSEKIDLILMDINLGKGKMDGIESMKKVRSLEAYNNIPVIAVTSYALPEDKQRFMREGFDDYLPKPVEKRILIERINKFLH
jgi:CheY-like chemotaxis protein